MLGWLVLVESFGPARWSEFNVAWTRKSRIAVGSDLGGASVDDQPGQAGVDSADDFVGNRSAPLRQLLGADALVALAAQQHHLVLEAGCDELVKKISDGWADFDVAIASPKVMGKVGKLGRVLGPQGKMPSPKNGTVTANVADAVAEFAAGKVEYRNDSGGNIHAVVGKQSFETGKLVENIEAFVAHIKKIKPTAAKGTYLKKMCISATMSPGITVDV